MAHLWYPYNLPDVEAHPAWIQFDWFERNSPTDSAPKDTIQLYMPEQAQQPSTVNWSQENFGFVGNFLRESAKGAINSGNLTSMQGVEDGIMGGIEGAANASQGMLQLAALRSLAMAGSNLAGRFGGSVTAEGLMGETMGKIPNPYLTYTFKGVDFRTFAFVFKFYPYREQDCEVIDEIIRIMRANSLPRYEEGTAFLGYPCECNISYKWRGKDNILLHRFKRAVCSGIDVDYTSQGMFSVMRNGFPSEITLSTKWTEYEIVTRSDVEDRTKRY